MRSFFRFLTVCAAVSFLAGPLLRAEILDYAANVTPECAGTASPNSGWGTFTIDTDTMGIDIRVDHSGVAVNAAHIHYLEHGCGNTPAGPWVVVLPTTMNPMEMSATLTADDMMHIFEGSTYVNLHSNGAPDGEIAGELWPVPKNRYLSFMAAVMTASSEASTQAIRVRMASLHHPDPPTPGSPNFSAFEGEYRWVGTPQVAAEQGGPNATYTFTTLQCTPEFRDWTDVPFLLHVKGSEVVPSSVYELQFVDDTCVDLNDPLCYSEPIIVTTSRWGDVKRPFAEYVGGTQPNFGDITEVIEKFKSLSAFILPRADFGSAGYSLPDGITNFADISYDVDAFKGDPYPFSMAACP